MIKQLKIFYAHILHEFVSRRKLTYEIILQVMIIVWRYSDLCNDYRYIHIKLNAGDDDEEEKNEAIIMVIKICRDLLN